MVRRNVLLTPLFALFGLAFGCDADAPDDAADGPACDGAKCDDATPTESVCTEDVRFIVGTLADLDSQAMVGAVVRVVPENCDPTEATVMDYGRFRVPVHDTGPAILQTEYAGETLEFEVILFDDPTTYRLHVVMTDSGLALERY